MNSSESQMAGYDFDSGSAAQSPLSVEDLHLVEQTVGWTNEDADVLLRHAAFFERHAEQMVDSWRAAIGVLPQLAQWFFSLDGNPDEEYKARVKRRFVQWVIDVATRPHDRAWLNYQEEIGLRHIPAKKNKTDGSRTSPLVPLRYVLAFLPVVFDIRNLLTTELSDPGEVTSVERSWTKAVHLHVVLWTRPYTIDGLW